MNTFQGVKKFVHGVSVVVLGKRKAKRKRKKKIKRLRNWVQNKVK